jgi:hypothetical protein
MKNKVLILYRVYPGISNSCKLNCNKIDLIRECLRSFKNAFSNIDYDFFALMDSCEEDIEMELKKYIGVENLTLCKRKNLGNFESFKYLIDYSLNQKTNKIFFLEDDYFFSNSFDSNNFVKALDHWDYITPYRSPENEEVYLSKRILSKKEDTGFQSTVFTTLTFATTVDVLRQDKKYFHLFERGIKDTLIWCLLTKPKNIYLYYFNVLFNFIRRILKLNHSEHKYRPGIRVMNQVFKLNFILNLFNSPKRTLGTPIDGKCTHLAGNFLEKNLLKEIEELGWIDNQYKYKNIFEK